MGFNPEKVDLDGNGIPTYRDPVELSRIARAVRWIVGKVFDLVDRIKGKSDGAA